MNIYILPFSIIWVCILYYMYNKLCIYLNRSIKDNYFLTPKITIKCITIINSIILLILDILYLHGHIPLELWTILQSIPIGYCLFNIYLYFNDKAASKFIELITIYYYCMFLGGIYFLFEESPATFSIGYLAILSIIISNIYYLLSIAKNNGIYSAMLYLLYYGVLITNMCINFIGLLYTTAIFQKDTDIAVFFYCINTIVHEFCVSV